MPQFSSRDDGSILKPTDRGLRDRTSVFIIAAFAVGCLVALPFAGQRGPEVPGITPLVAGLIFTTEASTSFLIFAWALSERTWSLIALGSAYLFGACVSVLHLLTFPGALVPGVAIIGSAATAGLVFDLWYSGYALLFLSAAILDIASVPDVRRETVAPAVAGSVAAVVGVVAIAAFAIRHLSAVPSGEGPVPAWSSFDAIIVYAALCMMGCTAVLILLRSRTPVFQLVSIVLASLVGSQLLSLAGGGRYTTGWLVGRVGWIVSAAVLFLFFIRQFVLQQRELSFAKAGLEDRVAARTRELVEIVAQRDLLLREVYHRVKNNLQMIDALIAKEARQVADPPVRDAFKRLSVRLHAIAVTHSQLMTSDNLSTFDIAPFLGTIGRNLSSPHGQFERGGPTVVEVVADHAQVGIDFALPVALIVTELVTNAFRHSLPEAGRVKVSFVTCADRSARLVIESDDVDEDAAQRFMVETGTGRRLIEGFVKQLNGALFVNSNLGLQVSIHLPLPEVLQ